MEFMLESHAPRLLSILRILTAFLFLAHATQKLFGFPAGPTAHVLSLLWVAGAIELVGGMLILVGLLTRPVALILAGEMAVAYFRVHNRANFWPLLNRGEVTVLYCFVFLYLAAACGGPWSIDRLRLGSRKR
jgi:putative oxidoreductase